MQHGILIPEEVDPQTFHTFLNYDEANDLFGYEWDDWFSEEVLERDEREMRAEIFAAKYPRWDDPYCYMSAVLCSPIPGEQVQITAAQLDRLRELRLRKSDPQSEWQDGSR